MIAKREVKTQKKSLNYLWWMISNWHSFVSYFWFAILLQTFSLINAFPFRHCAFYLFHSKFDFQFVRRLLTDFAIYLSKWPFLKGETARTLRSWKRHVCLVCGLHVEQSIERSRPRRHVACGNPVAVCLGGGVAWRTNCQTSFLTSKLFKTKSPRVDTKFTH